MCCSPNEMAKKIYGQVKKHMESLWDESVCVVFNYRLFSTIVKKKAFVLSGKLRGGYIPSRWDFHHSFHLP